MPDNWSTEKELAARLGAIEFLLQQLFTFRIKENAADPLEGALYAQGRAMTKLSDQLAAMPEGERKEIAKRGTEHVHRFYEQLVQRFENESS